MRKPGELVADAKGIEVAADRGAGTMAIGEFQGLRSSKGQRESEPDARVPLQIEIVRAVDRGAAPSVVIPVHGQPHLRAERINGVQLQRPYGVLAAHAAIVVIGIVGEKYNRQIALEDPRADRLADHPLRA